MGMEKAGMSSWSRCVRCLLDVGAICPDPLAVGKAETGFAGIVVSVRMIEGTAQPLMIVFVQSK